MTGARTWAAEAVRTLLGFLAAADRPRDRLLILGYFAFYLIGRVTGRPTSVGVRVRVGGAVFILRPDRADHVPLHEIYVIHSYQPDATWKPANGDTVIDLGANTGAFTVLAARAVGPTGRVAAVEPHPPNVRATRRNLAANGLGERVVMTTAAVWSKAGRGRLVRDRDSESEWRVESSPDGRVVLTTVDEVASGLSGRIQLLKCDIEGGELEAFHGAVATLDRTDRVVVECHSRRLRSDVTALLATHGLVPAFEHAQSIEVAVVGFVRRATLNAAAAAR